MDELVYPRLLQPIFAREPDAVAFIEEGGRRTSRGEHLCKVRRLASALKSSMGPDKPGRFAVLAYNSADYVALWHAALFGGGMIVPLNVRLSESELAFIVRDSGVEIMFADAAHLDLATRLASAAPEIRRICVIGGAEASAGIEGFSAGADERALTVSEDDRVLIMYTGGTTGTPKGVIHTQRSLVLGVYRQYFMFDLLRRPAVFHLAAGLFHIAATTGALAAPAAGARVIIASAYDSATFIDQTERYGITHAGFVVTMLSRMLDDPKFTPARVRTLRQISYGGSPMTLPLLERVRTILPDVDLLNAYGMTEAGLLSALGPEDHRQARGLDTVGQPLLGVEACVLGDDDKPAAPDTIGEICIRAGSVMAGYHARPEETAKAFRAGWFCTGDIGSIDATGRIRLIDRRNDMIITGGENVYPAEVENVLAAHPAVQQVAVFGIPDARWGEAVHAVVVAHPAAEVSAQELDDFARERIARYKCPKSYSFRTEPLPLSGANKVLKRALRDPFWAGAATVACNTKPD